jgi:raffinose/stachyose/melibiose transport system permease protein
MRPVTTKIRRETAERSDRPKAAGRLRRSVGEGSSFYERVMRRLVPYGFLAPALVIYIAFLVVPFFGTVWYSLTNWTGVGHYRFIGLRNYGNFAGDGTTLSALRNTVIWTVVMVVVPTIIGLLLANFLRGKGRWKGPVQAVFYLPAVLPMVGVALVWEWLYNPQFGFLNDFLKAIGLKSLAMDWLGSATTAEPALLIAGIWVAVGFPMVLYLAGLQTIPPELYEAARVDGGSRWAVFRHVTLPGLRQMHIVIVALEVISSLQVFAIIYALTDGGPGNSTQVLGTWMYANVFQFSKVGYGSAVGIVLTIMAMIVTVPYVLWMTRGE